MRTINTTTRIKKKRNISFIHLFGSLLLKKIIIIMECLLRFLLNTHPKNWSNTSSSTLCLGVHGKME